MKTSFALLLSVCLTLSACSDAPTLVVPTPPHDRYTALAPSTVHAITPREIVVAGCMQCADGTQEGLVLLSSDGGKSWRRLAVEAIDAGGMRLERISFIDRLRGWVAGVRTNANGDTRVVVLRTEDGGNHWRESVVPLQTDTKVMALRGLLRETDHEGTIAFSAVDSASGESRECSFRSADGGRSWIGLTWMQPATATVANATQSDLGSGQAFRLCASAREGGTILELTGNAGTSWMPVCEFGIWALPTYY